MREKEEELKSEKEKQSKMEDFRDKVNTTEDLSDLLQNFSIYLQQFTGATRVYVGKLIKPNKPIKDDSDDKEHEDPNTTEIIKYIHATPDQQFLIERTLTPEQGLTHEILKRVVKEGEGDGEAKDGGKEDEGCQEPEEPSKPVPQNIFVPEDVREPRMHYFRVPKLGSYLTVQSQI